MTYHKEGDYQIPDIKIFEKQDGTITIGKYGRMRKSYLMEHRNTQFQCLLLSNELTAHLIEMENTAQERMATIVTLIAKAQGITEKLKDSDQMAWLKAMNNIMVSAEKIVRQEIIYN